MNEELILEEIYRLQEEANKLMAGLSDSEKLSLLLGTDDEFYELRRLEWNL